MNTCILRRGGSGLAAITPVLLYLCVVAVMPAPARANDGLSSVNGAIHVAGSGPTGDVSTVNGSIHVDAHGHTGKISAVNGSIHIEADASVGAVSTVNGGIALDTQAAAESLGTVNGSIDLGPGAHVGGRVGSVNGGLKLEDGANVGGDLTSVNGSMHLADAHVGGSIRTHSGDVYVGPGSHIDGGIDVYRSHTSFDGWFDWLGFSNRRVPRIVIGPGAVVAGTLHFERPVELKVSRQAKIGRVEGATVIRF